MILQIIRRIAIFLAAFWILALAFIVSATSSSASANYGAAGLNWAEAHATGHWYGWGGTGPAVYDCSGLVSTSVLKATGKWIGRDTFTQIATMGEGHFERVSLNSIQRGDILYYGWGHVEFATVWYHMSFGAQQTGTQVGWHSWGGWWAPTMAFRIVR